MALPPLGILAVHAAPKHPIPPGLLLIVGPDDQGTGRTAVIPGQQDAKMDRRPGRDGPERTAMVRIIGVERAECHVKINSIVWF